MVTGQDEREGAGTWEDTAGSAAWSDEDSEELTFAEDEERLPWLESGDEDEAASGIDAGRVAMIGLIALAALAVIVGGVWWITNRSASEGEAPQGSVIAAPEEPYKTRPDDPGGKEFEGTGDTSFAVGEGETREGRLAETSEPETPAASPSPRETEAAPSIAAVSSDDAEEVAQANEGVGVQVGAYSNTSGAEAGWRTLTRQTEVLNGVRHRIVRGRADIGIVYRLQAIASDRAAADRLCADLKADGLACQVKP